MSAETQRVSGTIKGSHEALVNLSFAWVARGSGPGLGWQMGSTWQLGRARSS